MTVRRGLAPRLLPALASDLALSGSLALSSCGTPSSQKENDGAGAGVSATVGGVNLLNLLIVAGEEGGQGIICGAGDNTLDEQRAVDIQLESASGTT